MSEPAARLPPLSHEVEIDEVVTFWDITKRQFAKNRSAMVALYCVVGLIVLATGAPLITFNIPFLLEDSGGLQWPLFNRLFDRLIFPSGVDIFFNLLLIIFPIWWFGSRVVSASGLGPERRQTARLLRNGIPLLIVLAFYILLAVSERVIYARLAGIGLLGVSIMASQTRRSRGMGARRRRRIRVQTRFVLAGLFLLMFCLTLFRWVYSKDVEEWRPKVERVEASGGWALRPPIFYHPDNKGETNEITTARIRQPPSLETLNLLGCDNNGRDVFSRLLFGTRISLTIGIIAVSIYVTIGIILGSLAGYFGGKVDLCILFAVQVMMSIPALFLILTIVAMFESRSIFLIMAAIGLVSWTGITRIIRGEFFRQRSIDYVVAAKALGIPEHRIIFGHILKNALGPVIVAAAFGVGGAILSESFLSFIGLGDTNAPSWGQLLRQGLDLGKMWLILAPGLAIFFVVTVLNMVGDGLRDALDPKLRQ